MFKLGLVTVAFERGVSGRRQTVVEEEKPVVIIPAKPTTQPVSKEVPLQVQRQVEQEQVEAKAQIPATKEELQQPPPLTAGQKASAAMREPGLAFWYGAQRTPEQITVAPDVRYEYKPSSRQALAETFTTASTSMIGGSAFRALQGKAIIRRIMLGATVTSAGYDIGTTAYDIKSGRLSGSMIGYKAFQTGAGLLGFSYGAMGRGIVKTPTVYVPEVRPKIFKEPQSMFENLYVKNIVGYKTRPTTQAKLEMPGKYLMTREQMIRLESPQFKIPEIRSTSAEKILPVKTIEPPQGAKTVQLSMYGAKVYQKPMTTVSYPSKTPWKFESITKQQNLPPTNKWIDIRLENGKIITREIPFEKVKFSADTRAEASLLLMDRPTRPKMIYDSEIYTKMAEPYKPSFPRMGYFSIPMYRPMMAPSITRTFTVPKELQTPRVTPATIDIEGIKYGEMQRERQTPDIRQDMKDLSWQIDKQLDITLPREMQHQEQRQDILQQQDRLTEQVVKSQERMQRETPTRFFPSIFRLPEMSILSEVGDKESQQGFNVYIKDRTYVHGKQTLSEKWKKANTSPLSETQALSLGATAVDQSAAASFRIRQAEGQAKPLKIPVNPWGMLSSKFYKRDGTYIESTGSRIDSSGEVKGISALGWIANQQRSIQAMPSRQYKEPSIDMGLASRTIKVDYSHLLRGAGL